MRFAASSILAGLANLSLALAASSTTNSIPTSTDAASYLSEIWPSGPTPTWATGKYATTLASALYSVQTSFAERTDYYAIITAVRSAASEGGDDVAASVRSSGWDWISITTAGWYTSNVPKALQTEVAKQDKAWESVISSVEAKATATATANGAAAAKCTGMALAGVAAGVAAVAGMM